MKHVDLTTTVKISLYITSGCRGNRDCAHYWQSFRFVSFIFCFEYIIQNIQTK